MLSIKIRQDYWCAFLQHSSESVIIDTYAMF